MNKKVWRTCLLYQGLSVLSEITSRQKVLYCKLARFYWLLLGWKAIWNFFSPFPPSNFFFLHGVCIFFHFLTFLLMHSFYAKRTTRDCCWKYVSWCLYSIMARAFMKMLHNKWGPIVPISKLCHIHSLRKNLKKVQFLLLY